MVLSEVGGVQVPLELADRIFLQGMIYGFGRLEESTYSRSVSHCVTP